MKPTKFLLSVLPFLLLAESVWPFQVAKFVMGARHEMVKVQCNPHKLKSGAEGVRIRKDFVKGPIES